MYITPELLRLVLHYVSDYRDLLAFIYASSTFFRERHSILKKYYLSIIDKEQEKKIVPPPNMIKDLIHAIHIRKSPWCCEICKIQNNRLKQYNNTFLDINIRACKKHVCRH